MGRRPLRLIYSATPISTVMISNAAVSWIRSVLRRHMSGVDAGHIRLDRLLVLLMTNDTLIDARALNPNEGNDHKTD